MKPLGIGWGGALSILYWKCLPAATALTATSDSSCFLAYLQCNLTWFLFVYTYQPEHRIWELLSWKKLHLLIYGWQDRVWCYTGSLVSSLPSWALYSTPCLFQLGFLWRSSSVLVISVSILHGLIGTYAFDIFIFWWVSVIISFI